MPRLHFESPPSASSFESDGAAPRARRRPWKILVAAGVAVALILALAALQHLPDKEAAATALEQVRQHARIQNRLVLLYFTAANCPACTKMDHQVWPDEAVRQLIERRYVLHRIEPGDPMYAGLSAEHGVEAPPAVVITAAGGAAVRDGEGRPLRHGGYLDASSLHELLSSALSAPGARSRTEYVTRSDRARRSLEAKE